MKIVFWGGPADGRVGDFPGLNPIRWPGRGAYWYTEDAEIIYLPRQLDAPIMQPLGQHGWWVMIPDGTSDAELEAMLARHSTPIVDGDDGWL